MKKWDKYLTGDYNVVMDNDNWWFVKKDDPEQDWIEVGGSGPRGFDLLVYLLKKQNIEVEMV